MRPFSREILDEILQTQAGNPLRITSRENSYLEFKQNFGLRSLASYAKTMAAFANANGGYIIYGVKNSPHDIVGLNGNIFDEFDPAKFSEYLNSHFSSEIGWEKLAIEVAGKKLGLIYTHEALAKPIICTKTDSDDIRDSDIYYRYRGRSERIKSPELNAILEKEKRKERTQWMQFLRKIAKVDLKNIAILELESGQISGHSKSYVLPKELLNQVKFVREGRFVESEGAPALRLLGDAFIIGPEHSLKESQIPKAIRTQDIIDHFLSNRKASQPLEYILQACHEQTPYLPVLFFADQCKEDVDEIISEIKKEKDATQTQKKGIVDRLSRKAINPIGVIDKDTDSAKLRKHLRDQIASGKSIQITTDNRLKLCESITHLAHSDATMNSDLIRSILRDVWNKKDELKPIELTMLRKVTCWFDQIASPKAPNKILPPRSRRSRD